MGAGGRGGRRRDRRLKLATILIFAVDRRGSLRLAVGRLDGASGDPPQA
jgi:hypothetical protein